MPQEERTAIDKAVWVLALEIFTATFGLDTIWVVLVADIIGHVVKVFCRHIFFSYKLPPNVPPSRDPPARIETLRYWHDLAETGKWVCIAGSFILCVATLALAALSPQLRAGAVARAFLVEQ